MNAIIVDFQVAPQVAMPEPLQTIFFWIAVVAVAALFLYSLWLSKSYKSLVPVLLVAAGGAGIPLEPICGFLGHVTHPPEGSISMFETITRVIPWHIFLGYTAGFGLMNLALLAQRRNGMLTPGFFWKTCAVSVIGFVLFEIYPVSQGLWVYYDPQPLWIWKGMAPITWAFMNTACGIMAITMILVLLPYLKGASQLMILPLGAIGIVMGHLGSGWPMYSIINSSAATSTFWVELSGVATLACSVTIMWFCSVVLTRYRQV